MAGPTNPEYRLRNLKRQLRDLLMGRRLSADPERTGVVSLADFGKQCDALADFAAQSVAELREVAGGTARCAEWVAEEVELAARLAARMETLPRNPARIDRQCGVLEEAAARVEAALDSELALEEAAAVVNLAALAGHERDLFDGLVECEGKLEAAPPGRIDAGPLRRRLRRALLAHERGPFALSVRRDGTLEFGEDSYWAAPAGTGLARGAHEPPEVKKALDLRAAAPDPALADFLLVKAVDEALAALLAPHLQGSRLVERARALPHRPGKRFTVRPEAVRRERIPGWDPQEAARGVDKIAARRAGPEWTRLPKGAYVLHLFVHEDEALAADLLALGPALRRMEKGEAAEGTAAPAERALRALLALLG